MPGHTTEQFLRAVLKIHHFTDDTTLYLQDKEDLDIAMEIFSSFAAIAWLKMTLKIQRPGGYDPKQQQQQKIVNKNTTIYIHRIIKIWR